MTIEFQGFPVEVDIDRNIDGSKFIAHGVWLDGPSEDLALSECELDQIQNENEGEEWLNGLWRG